MKAYYLIVDCETGGLDPFHHSLLEVAAALFGPGGMVTSLRVTIREPRMALDPRALEVNGTRIDGEWLGKAWKPVEAVTDLSLFVSECVEVAAGELERDPLPLFTVMHNPSFDTAFIRRLWRVADRGAPPRQLTGYHVLDTYTIAQALQFAGLAEFERGNLDACLRGVGLDPEVYERHTAMGDVMATGDFLAKALELLEGVRGE